MRQATFICATRVEFGIDTPASVGLGGIESTNLALARALARRGWAVTLATRRAETVERDGIRNVPLAEAARHPADAVVSSNDPKPLRDHPAGRRIVWVHNPVTIEKGLRKRILLPVLALRPDAVFVGSLAAAAMAPVFAYRRRRVIPHGVGPAFRERAPTRGTGRDFVFASQPQRGLARILAIWRNAAGVAASGARLHVFGSGAPASADPSGPIVYHPRLGAEALAAFYAGARAMICPGAVDETFCLAAAEAQAMGLPVITAGIGALSERVQHGINGLIAPSDRDLAEAIVQVAGNDALWAQLSAGALLQRTALTWERAAILWEAALDDGPGAATGAASQAAQR